MTLLDVRDLVVTYRTSGGPVTALRGVDLELDAGGTLGVAGESGCGKSTLALALLRLLPPGASATGEILLSGEDVMSMRWGRIRAVRWNAASIVFQGAMHSLNPVRKVGQQVAEPLFVHGQPTKDDAYGRVRTLLEQVGLSARYAESYPHELSGGQRQRVMIAMALACEPELIVADESTTALDVMIQAQVLDLVADLVAERGIGLMMISHDLSVLAATCERLAVMYAGRIVEQGPSREVLDRARHPYTAALSAAFPAVGDPASRLRPSGLAGDPPDPRALPAGCAFHPRCPVVEPGCVSLDVGLRDVAPDWQAACVHVGARAEERT